MKLKYKSTSLVNFNGKDKYNFLVYFKDKQDPSVIFEIPQSNIKNLIYTDDIYNIGLVGTLEISDTANIYASVLNNTDSFYVCVYVKDVILGYEDNINFSIISSKIITKDTNTSIINLELYEACMAEGINRNVRALTVKESLADPSGNSFSNLIKFIYNLLTIDIGEPSPSQMSITNDNKGLKDVFNLDEDSLKQYDTTGSSDVLASIIVENIKSSDSVLDLMNNLNRKLCFYKNERLGFPGTFRSENVTGICTNDLNRDTATNVGERKLVLRNILNTFEDCFSNNLVYEILTTTVNNLKYRFMCNPPISNIEYFPVNISLINNLWCDFIPIFTNDDKAFISEYYQFNSMIDLFKKYFLKNDIERLDANKNKIIFNISSDNGITSRGVAAKALPYDSEKLIYAIISNMLKSFFTVNTTIKLVTKGQVYRKANEITYIDNTLKKGNDTENEGSAISGSSLSNKIPGNYYFVTRVVHKFTGNSYINEIFLCSFTQ